jgi:hypothetical protein
MKAEFIMPMWILLALAAFAAWWFFFRKTA